jgi:hypothetical protein
MGHYEIAWIQWIGSYEASSVFLRDFIEEGKSVPLF